MISNYWIARVVNYDTCSFDAPDTLVCRCSECGAFIEVPEKLKAVKYKDATKAHFFRVMKHDISLTRNTQKIMKNL